VHMRGAGRECERTTAASHAVGGGGGSNPLAPAASLGEVQKNLYQKTFKNIFRSCRTKKILLIAVYVFMR